VNFSSLSQIRERVEDVSEVVDGDLKRFVIPSIDTVSPIARAQSRGKAGGLREEAHPQFVKYPTLRKREGEKKWRSM